MICNSTPFNVLMSLGHSFIKRYQTCHYEHYCMALFTFLNLRKALLTCRDPRFCVWDFSVAVLDLPEYAREILSDRQYRYRLVNQNPLGH